MWRTLFKKCHCFKECLQDNPTNLWKQIVKYSIWLIFFRCCKRFVTNKIWIQINITLGNNKKFFVVKGIHCYNPLCITNVQNHWTWNFLKIWRSPLSHADIGQRRFTFLFFHFITLLHKRVHNSIVVAKLVNFIYNFSIYLEPQKRTEESYWCISYFIPLSLHTALILYWHHIYWS